MRTEGFKGALLSTLMIASIMALAIPLLSPSLVHALTPHAPIYISDNSGFTKPDPVNGGGSGTENDPYIIENYIIDATSLNPYQHAGIEIRNTNAHFVIRNCYVYDGKSTGMDGIRFYQLSNGKITDCITENNRLGANLQFLSSITIENCRAENNSMDGILLYRPSSNNTITNCTAKNNLRYGIFIGDQLNNNTITNCTVENNDHGIHITSSSTNNTITNCTASNNNYGIYFKYASNNNSIYHNNFVNNENQAHDECSNYWDNGYPWGGNYWSDYTGADIYRGESQNLLGSDWIGDTPYYIPGDNNRDHYPLMNPFPLPYTGWARVPPILVIMIYPPPSLHTIYLEMNLALYQGSKLVVKFYTWWNEYENERVIENFTPPWHVKKTEVVPHPGNLNVKRAKLDLTTDNTENVISTIASFILTRDDLFSRIMAIKGWWPIADDNERNALFQEIMDIKGQWPSAPS